MRLVSRFIVRSALVAMVIALAPRVQAQAWATGVVVMECAAAPLGQDDIVALDLKVPAADGTPTAVVGILGEGPLNTFLRRTESGVEGCVEVAQGIVVARDVAAKIPDVTCDPNAARLATDLIVVKLPPEAPAPASKMVIVEEGRLVGRVIAIAGTRLLVNLEGTGLEKISRAVAASEVTERVRTGDVGMAGRVVGQQSESDAAPALGSKKVVAEIGTDTLEDEPFVFLSANACQK